MADLKKFGERLKEYRSKEGLTQREMADKINLSAATLSSYENGSKNPSLSVVMDIAKTINVSLDWLCGLSSTNNQGTNSDEILLTDIFEAINTIVRVLPYTEMQKINVERINANQAWEILLFSQAVGNYLDAWQSILKLNKNGALTDSVYAACLEGVMQQYKDMFIDTTNKCIVNPDGTIYESLQDPNYDPSFPF